MVPPPLCLEILYAMGEAVILDIPGGRDAAEHPRPFSLSTILDLILDEPLASGVADV